MKNGLSNIVLLIILFISTLPCLSYAQNPQGDKIEGAFGLKLGDKYTNNQYDYVPIFNVNPTIKSEFFQEYYVATTPLSGNIISIVGLGPYTQAKICQAAGEEVNGLLKAKYKYNEEGTHHIVYPSSLLSDKHIKAVENNLFYFASYISEGDALFGLGNSVELFCVISYPSHLYEKHLQCLKLSNPYSADDLLFRDFGVSYYNYFEKNNKFNLHAFSRYKFQTHASDENLRYYRYLIPYYYINNIMYWVAPTRWADNDVTSACNSLPKKGNYRLMIKYNLAGADIGKELDRAKAVKASQKPKSKGL